MIIYCLESGNLYDKDEATKEISKVLRCFHNDNAVTFEKFYYADNDEYVELNNEEVTFVIKNQIILKYYFIPIGCTYYLEDGSRPLKTKDCAVCEWSDECNHNQKYYNKE
jgi:hypothetical protein